MYSEYLSIGEVLRPQGVRGQVKVRPDTDDPARFLSLENVYIRQGENYVPCVIADAQVRGDGYVYCVLNGAADRDAAEGQRGWLLYVDRAHAVQLEEGRYFISDLLGCRVQDRQGNLLGHIDEVLQPGANDVYQIKRPDGRMIYLPVLPFVVIEVQIKEGYITVNEERLPEVAVFED